MDSRQKVICAIETWKERQRQLDAVKQALSAAAQATTAAKQEVARQLRNFCGTGKVLYKDEIYFMTQPTVDNRYEVECRPSDMRVLTPKGGT